MAAMESSKPEGLSREVLEQALAGTKVEELQEMGKRLTKSQQQFEEMLEELKAEQQELREENTNLHDTIGKMHSELQKLNIGADNTVTPQLDEGPLNFVGRFWEKVKPRDTAVQINEHVGEIKKPVLNEDGGYPTHTPQEVGKQVVQKLRGDVQNLRGALGPLWQRAEAAVNDARGEIVKKVNEVQAERSKQQWNQRGSQQSDRGVDGEAPCAANATPQAPAGSSAAASTPAQEASEPTAAAAAAPAQPAPAPSSQPAPGAPAASDAGEAADDSAPGEQISSTILIEAQLKIDDGSTQTLRLRAADRCKEVSARFVQEHSLKAWFTEPLTAWLKQVENDAVKFPVTVEADLMEIRKQYSKSK